jgi:hypothetical protein
MNNVIQSVSYLIQLGQHAKYRLELPLAIPQFSPAVKETRLTRNLASPLP